MFVSTIPGVGRSVKIFHLPTTGGQKQPYPSTPSVTVQALAFEPMSAYQHALEGGNLMNPYELYVEQSVDIRIGDKVNLSGDSTDYFVKRITPYPFGNLSHTRASCSTQP